MDLLVAILPSAQRDLAEIGRYIARDNPERALTYVVELAGRTDRLAGFPDIGQRLPRARGRNVREIIYGNYRIIYRVKRQAGLVEVLRFWHAARGEPQLFDFEP